MKPSPRENAEVMLGETERKSAIEKVIDFRNFISTPSREFDEIDLACDFGSPQSRKESETRRLLDLIDNLPISDNGKEGRA